MQGAEKYGGLWVGSSDGEPVFEQHDSNHDLMLAVWRTHESKYRASIFEKSYDYRWTIPVWNERRPEGWFANEEEARAYLVQRIETDYPAMDREEK